MSIGAQSVGQSPVGGQADRRINTPGPPGKRTIIAQPDRPAHPEAR